MVRGGISASPVALSPQGVPSRPEGLFGPLVLFLPVRLARLVVLSHPFLLARLALLSRPVFLSNPAYLCPLAAHGRHVLLVLLSSPVPQVVLGGHIHLATHRVLVERELVEGKLFSGGMGDQVRLATHRILVARELLEGKVLPLGKVFSVSKLSPVGRVLLEDQVNPVDQVSLVDPKDLVDLVDPKYPVGPEAQVHLDVPGRHRVRGSPLAHAGRDADGEENAEDNEACLGGVII
ncbi:hypothetical protein LA080_013174 [Diaporthe eres]|nr:hypothetical protein LA080_013174 [Diaporthe eres]